MIYIPVWVIWKPFIVGNPKWRRSNYGGYMSWPTKSQFLLVYLRILYESMIFDYSHRCVGCLQVKIYHRVAKFLRKRLLSACEVWTTILALKNVAPKSTNQIKDYTNSSDFCIFSSIYLFIYSFHLITKWQKVSI